MENLLQKLSKKLNLVAIGIALLLSSQLMAQTLSTTSSFLNNNGSGTVVFNLQNTNSYPINISEIRGVTGTAGTVAVEMYYKTTPLPGGAPGTINSANGWNLISAGSITGIANSSTTVTQTFFSGLNFIIPANTTYAIAVFAAGQRYFSITATGTTTISQSGVNLITGQTIGYAGGTPPAAPTNASRGWIGEIVFSPSLPCSGTPTSGNAITSAGYVCNNQPFNLSLANDSIRTGLTYQWLKSTVSANGPFTSNISDSTRTFKDSITTNTWYKCLVSCGTNSDSSTAVLVKTSSVPLSGTVTVNALLPSSSTNYVSLNDLAAELACVGVSGPLAVNIDSLPNNQIVTFNTIVGASATNTVTINGKNKVLTAGASPIIRFNGTKFLTVDSLKIIGATGFAGFGVQIGGQSENITIKNSIIDVGTTSTATSNTAIAVSNSTTSATTAGNNARYLTISNNTIIGGYYGITLMGEAGYLNNFGHTISNNTIRDFYLYGVYFVNADSSVLHNNDINRATRSTISTFYGVYLATSRNIKVTNNKIKDAGTGSYGAYPIYLSNCVSSVGYENIFANNLIYNINTTSTFYGIYSLTTALTGAKFLHNTINHDITGSTGAIRGAFFNVATNNVVFRNNIISIKGSGTGIKATIYATNALTGFVSNNNILLNTATGGTNLVGYWAANQITLANWRTASSQDLNSVDTDPLFVNPNTGLFMPNSSLVDNLGSPQGILTDILGNTRSLTTPDIGSYEFSFAVCSGVPITGNAISNLDTACASEPISLSLVNDSLSAGLTYQWLRSTTGLSGSYTAIPNDTNRVTTEFITATTWFRCVVSCATSTLRDTSTAVRVVIRRLPLSGNFTVNSLLPISSTNYQSLASLVNDLTCGGVSGPINIDVINVTGNQNLNFGAIAGTSSVNVITVNGKNNTITSGVSPIVTFSGTKYVIIDSLNIVGTSGYTGFGVHIGNQSENITIKNSNINVGVTSTATSNAGVVISGSQTAATTAGTNGKYISLINNTITGGYYGITLTGDATVNYSMGHNIINNNITNFYLYGIYLINTDSSFVINNDVNRISRASISTFYGIYTSLGSNLKIRNNKIHDAGTGSYSAYPIYIANCVNQTGFETEFTNNAIYNNNTTATFYGIYSLTTALTRVNFYHNTISHNVTGSTGTIRGAFFSVAITNVNFKNNIISMDGNGTGVKTCIYVTTTSTTFASNNNVLYMGATGGTNVVGYWGANQATIADWRTASSQDINSVGLNPVFTNLSAGLLIPVSVNADNIGTPVGILTDLAGNSRSVTTPDAGAYEFVGLGGDVSINDATLLRSSSCYSVNDSAKFTIENLFGNTIDFSINPLTIVYQVNGPINTLDSIILVFDTLAPGTTKTIAISNINASLPGAYALKAYIRPNTVNANVLNDTILAVSNMVVDNILSVSPKTAVVTSSTDTVILTARSPLAPGDSVFFSEIAHYKVATGAPIAGWPTYLLADDYVELTGVPNSSIAGYTMEEWTGTTLQHTVTFPAGTIFSPNGTMILATGQLGSSVPSPSNFYYHTGNTVTHSSTGDNRGYIIKNPSGAIMDATVYGTYTFPVASGVTTAIWSGSTPAVSSSGNRLNAPDNNTASCWVNSGTTPQNPNALNSGVSTPAPSSVIGFNWYYLGSPVSNNFRMVVGPYTAAGTYTYVAEYITLCGTFYDTAIITASGTVPVKLTKFNGNKLNNDVVLNWETASEMNNSHFDIQFSTNQKQFTTIGKVKGAINSNTQLKYNFNHQDALLNFSKNSKLYYRLAQHDLDGKVTFSNIVTIDNENQVADEIAVFPNPNNGEFSVNLNLNNGMDGNLLVVNSLGKEVLNTKISLGKGNHTFNFDAALPAGIYVVMVEQNNQKLVTKMVIQK